MLVEAWESFAYAVIPTDASRSQKDEMRRAFYAGAKSLLCGMIGMLGKEEEPTEKELLDMDAVVAELDRFEEDVKKGLA